MIFTRAEIVSWQATNLMIGATIAARYSCVRRQGEIIPGFVSPRMCEQLFLTSRDGEVKLLDYQTQQNRIFPAIAKSFAFHLAAEEIRKIAADTLAKMKKGNVSSERLKHEKVTLSD